MSHTIRVEDLNAGGVADILTGLISGDDGTDSEESGEAQHP
jgi:hypothetical protein